MTNHAKRAEELFREGYNCAQAVFIAFNDLTGYDEKTAAMLASSFGGGLGRMREVCGAVSGMSMVLGALEGYSDPDDKEGKKAQYELIRELAGKFKEENGSILCKELLGLSSPEASAQPEARTPEYYQKRPCAELVAQCAAILDEYLNNKKA